jgi:hypothetical protein
MGNRRRGWLRAFLSIIILGEAPALHLRPLGLEPARNETFFYTFGVRQEQQDRPTPPRLRFWGQGWGPGRRSPSYDICCNMDAFLLLRYWSVCMVPRPELRAYIRCPSACRKRKQQHSSRSGDAGKVIPQGFNLVEEEACTITIRTPGAAITMAAQTQSSTGFAHAPRLHSGFAYPCFSTRLSIPKEPRNDRQFNDTASLFHAAARRWLYRGHGDPQCGQGGALLVSWT